MGAYIGINKAGESAYADNARSKAMTTAQKRTVSFQWSATAGEWVTQRTRTAQTEIGLRRICASLYDEYADDERRTRGGNVMGTVRYRFVLDGKPVETRDFYESFVLPYEG